MALVLPTELCQCESVQDMDLLLTQVLRLVTSLGLDGCLIAYARKDWKEGSNIYCDFKRTSTSISSNRNVPSSSATFHSYRKRTLASLVLFSTVT